MDYKEFLESKNITLVTSSPSDKEIADQIFRPMPLLLDEVWVGSQSGSIAETIDSAPLTGFQDN